MGRSTARIIDDNCLDELTAELLSRSASMKRMLVGIAGIPGSGKSTLAGILMEAMHRCAPSTAVLVPMDGFHLSNQRLADLDLVSRKGAPETFDADAYLELLGRARSRGDSIPFPIYDRERHEPVMDHAPEHTIAPHAQVILTEGNYLLLDTEPWNRLATILGACWFLETPMGIARKWTIQRHIRGGRNSEDATAQYERNDAVNANLVLERRRTPDLILRWDQEQCGDGD